MSILDLLRAAPRAGRATADGPEALYPILFQRSGGLPTLARELAPTNAGGVNDLLAYGMGGVGATFTAGLPALVGGINTQQNAELLERERRAADLRDRAAMLFTGADPFGRSPAAPASALTPPPAPIEPALWRAAEQEVRAQAGPGAAITEADIRRQAEVIRLGLHGRGAPPDWRG